MYPMLSRLLLIAATMLTMLANLNAQTSKGGAARLNSGWKLLGDELAVNKTRVLFASTGYGVSFNVAGAGFLHQAYWVCASSYEIVDGKGNETAACTATDQDGDQVWTALTSSGPKDGADIVGTQVLRDGSGKFKGISGTMTHICTILPQFHQLACAHDATYRLP
jgi:hypothetical protein